ncbi:MAG: LapA family protein [Leptolyngbyaceae cyanobacterium SM1_1_3]|nr:LapA family protein [Leptolyngbyaceae cyanobacterium SM1_1_3]NJM85769.1 LapA family protein [Leptolyngbyaceae cyanobacterium RM2_2_21]NJN04213.1 LapA family protein [Leptolyngbyaceae cyanobacterium RM1_1_2]NJO08342.1 LapA family protein [Leptolyngbyaceae cyanobacterium SL_1_1]
MRQINFVVIFVICLALVLFGIENTDPAPIHIVRGVDLQAPLCVELIVSMGIGAVLAWVFSVWIQLQNHFVQTQEVQQRDTRIQELEQNIERYRVELEEQKPLLPASKNGSEEAESSEAYAS